MEPPGCTPTTTTWRLVTRRGGTSIGVSEQAARAASAGRESRTDEFSAPVRSTCHRRRAPSVELDAPYSGPDTTVTDWTRAQSVLAGAAIYWLSTVRSNQPPPRHTGDRRLARRSGLLLHRSRPQKAQNLAANSKVVVTTGKKGGRGSTSSSRAPPAVTTAARSAPSLSRWETVRQRLALRRRRRGLPPRGRPGSRLHDSSGEGLRLRPRRARWRHPLPILSAATRCAIPPPARPYACPGGPATAVRGWGSDDDAIWSWGPPPWWRIAVADATPAAATTASPRSAPS